MASKRSVLALLSRSELLGVVDRFEITVADRRKKEGVVEAVAGSKKATLAAILPDLSRDRLKEFCRSLGIDDSGREKTALVDRLSGNGAAPVAPKKVRSPKPPAARRSPAAKPAKPAARNAKAPAKRAKASAKSAKPPVKHAKGRRSKLNGVSTHGRARSAD